MPSYTLAAIKEARDRVRQDMIDEQNAMYGTAFATPQHLSGLEVEARLQTYLQYGLTLDELEPVAREEPTSSRSVVDIYNEASDNICASLQLVIGVSRLELVENQEPDRLRDLIRNRLDWQFVTPTTSDAD